MQKLMKWVGSPADWAPSDMELPRVDHEADAALQRWSVVAGGLGLVLSRLGPVERSARFAHTQALYGLIRRRMQQSQPVHAGPELIGEVMHEIAETADRLTRACLKACFHSSMGDAAAAVDLPRGDLPGSSQGSAPPSQTRSSRRNSRRPDPGSADTSFNTQMLAERANALRSSLAAARKPAAGSGYVPL